MRKGSGGPLPELSPNPYRRGRAFYPLLAALLMWSGTGGCASPSEPIERKPPVAQPVTDLHLEQQANQVVLTFTLPTQTVDRRPLNHPLAIEIYRGIGASGADSEASMTLVATIPSSELSRYRTDGHVRYVDPLEPEDFAQRDVAGASYSIRTRASVKKDSGSSNVAYLLIRPALEPIADVRAQVTQSAIVLTWTRPAKTFAGSQPPVTGYRIYRAENTRPETSISEGSKTPLVKIGDSASPDFQDTQFVFGKTYSYSVRSVVGSGLEAVESADSNLVTITPRDTFPPAAPSGLVVALVPRQADVPAHLELSWTISPETDLAGYYVYRGEREGAERARLNTELLLAPAFRDMNVQPGRRYFYTVTAVDRYGNESPASDVVSGGVPTEGQSTP